MLKRDLDKSKCLGVMFAEAAMQIDYDQFLDSVAKRLKNLEFNSFIKAEVSSFRAIMLKNTHRLG